MEKEVKKSRFREVYDSLPARSVQAPKQDFVQKIADVTMSHPNTVKAWIYGVQKPDPLKIKMISNELGIPVEELFD